MFSSVFEPPLTFCVFWAMKMVKVPKSFQIFCFFLLRSKNLHFASAGVNFGYWLGKKINKNAIFSHFWPSFQGCYMHYFDLFFVFLASLKSGNDFLYPHHGRSKYMWTREKMKILIFFENLKIFQIFTKTQNFHFFLLFTAMC